MRTILVADFTIPGEVVPQARPRFRKTGNFVQAYQPEACANFKTLVKLQASEAWADALDEESSFAVTASFYLEIPKSQSKKRKQMMAKDEILPNRKPDLDNALKGILDGITGVIWKDDSQVCQVAMSKKYSDKPRTVVCIYTLHAFHEDEQKEMFKDDSIS